MLTCCSKKGCTVCIHGSDQPYQLANTAHAQVRTNIEDFDMEADDAVKSAVEEFTLQNYDMSCVVKTAAGKELAK